jgi:exopolysaccharide biosynthesis polyprenyl glycosylphosphotransferase
LVAGSSYRIKVVVTLAGDALLVMTAYLLCFYVRSATTFPLGTNLIPLARFPHLTHYWAALLVSQLVWIYLWGLYDEIWTRPPGEIIFPVLTGVTLQTLFLGMFYGFASQSVFPRTIFPLFWIINSVLIILWRALIALAFRDRRRKNILVVGVNATAAQLIRLLESQPRLGLQVAGVVKAAEAEAREGATLSLGEPFDGSSFCGYPVWGTVDDIDRLTSAHGIDEVVIASDSGWQDRLIDRLGKSSRLGLRLSLVPSVYEILIGKPQHLRIRDIPLIEVASDPNPASRLLMKRLLDILVSALLLTLMVPLLILVAIYVRLSSSGPIFYTQERIGKDGAVFRVIKFRTMVPDAERDSGAVLSKEDDPRVTRAGRLLRTTRLDELPQLFNVLQGEMSFIGPRPERPVFVSEFERTVPGYAQRHKVKPGITGLAQVNGFYDTDVGSKLKYDIYYIHNYSLWLDLTIVLATMKTMITRRGT